MTIDIAHSQTFEIDGQHDVTVVGDSIDVFLTRINTDSQRRFHLCTLRDQDVFPAFDANSLEQWQLIGVPYKGARLQPLDTATALSSARLVSSLEALGKALLQETESLTGLPVQTNDTVILAPTETYQLNFPALLAFAASAEVAVDDVRLAIPAPGGSLSLPSHLTFAVSEEVPVVVTPLAAVDTTDVTHDARAALSRFAGMVISHRVGQISRDEAALVHRMSRVAEQNRSHHTRSRLQLFRTTELRKGQFDDIDRHQPNLAWALAMLGRVQNIVFTVPADVSTAGSDNALIDHVCSSSGTRFREVALKGDWWKHDNGVLLVRSGEQGPWAVVKPGFLGGNRLYLQDQEHPIEVDERAATQLHSFAFSFYPPLPSRPIQMKDVLKLGLHGNWSMLLAIIGVSMLTGLLGLISPRAMGYLVDTVLPAADVGNLWLLAGLLVLVGVASTAIGIYSSTLIVRMESKIGNVVQSAVWDRVLRLPLTFLRQYSTGDLAQRISSINQIRHQLSVPTMQALLGGIFSIFNFFILFAYSLKLAIVALVLAVFTGIVSAVLGMFKLQSDRKLIRITADISNFEFQTLLGISRVRVSSAETRFFGRWVQLFKSYRQFTYRGEFILNIEHTYFQVFPLIATGLFMFFMSQELVQKSGSTITAGQYVAFTAAFGVFFGGMTHVVETLLSLIRLIPIYQSAKPILDAIPESSESAANPGQLRGDISVSNVSFKYGDGPLILDDVSLHIKPGEYVALVGPSGSGKSTLFRLLLGFERPLSGSVNYDGQDLSTLNMGLLRRQLGVVLQNGKLIAADIYENIVGSARLPLERAMEAARMVGLDGDLAKMPMGIHTVISDGSSTLSGGQRQRILIARAIVNRPKVLYFDEATSALDNVTQAVVTSSLDRMSATRVVIAHRLSTIINADRIIVLAGGKVVQEGTYQSLSTQPGIFKDMVDRQEA